MVVVTTYKMQRSMQIIILACLHLTTHIQGGTEVNCQRFQIRSSETSLVKLNEI